MSPNRAIIESIINKARATCRIGRVCEDGAVLATFDWVGEEMPIMALSKEVPLPEQTHGFDAMHGQT